TGFTESTLAELRRRLDPLRRADSPFDVAPKLPRETVFVEPEVVADVELREWTSDGVMRAPSFKGFRDDKSAADVVLEAPGGEHEDAAAAPTTGPEHEAGLPPDSPEALFEEVERLPEGSLSVVVDGRALKITNWEKVLYPETGFTKGDLIAYYARVAPAVL